MNGLTVNEVTKSFGATRALSGVSFTVQPGEIIALLGPSGCGKSTLLALIAGLDAPDRGEITWEGQPLAHIPPHKRGFGLMFQDFALFPHLNVQDNIAFGLRTGGMPAEDIHRRVIEVLQIVGLPSFARRDVNTLSGGEQQRVALARSLAPHPRLLMLDEPLGSLDRSLRERLVGDLGRILRHTQQTAIYVTHDQEEAFALADRILVMNAGQIVQAGAPQEIFLKPASPFVARFLELTNIFEGEVRKDGEKITLFTPIGKFLLSGSATLGAVQILLRPEHAHLDDSGPCIIHGIVQEVSFRGNWQRLSLMVNQSELTFDFPASLPMMEPGEAITLSLDPEQAIQVFSQQPS